jgi:hypothetical protein
LSKVLFLPVGIVGGLVAGTISKKLFGLAWSRVSGEDAPAPVHREASWPALVAALALEGAIVKIIRGVVERGSRIGFYRLTGSWPGEEEPESTT